MTRQLRTTNEHVTQQTIETDYLVVGTGATEMAFVDTLLDETAAFRPGMVASPGNPESDQNVHSIPNVPGRITFYSSRLPLPANRFFRTMNQQDTLQKETRPAHDRAETSSHQLRPKDALVLLLEMQPQIVAASRTQPPDQLQRAAAALTGCARELGIPVLASGVPLAPGMAPELIEELAGCTMLPRTSISALDDETVAGQLASSGRKLVAIGGVSSEIAVLRAALSARRLGYEVHVLADCCGGLGERSEQAAWRQMEAAGVVLSSVSSFLTGLITDLDSPDGRVVMNALKAFWS